MKNVLIFACFEQYFLIFEVTPRTAGSEDISIFHALYNILLLSRSPKGLPGVQDILIFTCFQEYILIFEVTTRQPGVTNALIF